MFEKIFGLDFNNLMEITFTLIMLYLILRNASGFSSAIRAVSSAYVSGVRALQGN